MDSDIFDNYSDYFDLNNSTYSCEVQVQRIKNFIEENLGTLLLPVHISLCALSILASLVNVAVLTRPLMISSSLNILLISLEISNFLQAAAYLPSVVVLHSYTSLLVHKSYAVFLIVVMSIAWSAVAFTVWITPIIGAWRYLAVVWPLKASVHLTRFRAVALVSCLAPLCAATYVLTNIFTDSDALQGGSLLCDRFYFDDIAEYTYDGLMNDWVEHFTVLTILFVIIPYSCVVIITACLVWSLCLSVRKRRSLVGYPGSHCNEASVRSTFILIILLIGFLVSNSSPYLSVALDRYNSKRQLPYPWKYVCDEFMIGLVVNLLAFFGYYFMGSKFRETFWGLLKCSR